MCEGLNRRGMTETYDANIRQMITNGYAESVPEAEILKDDGTVWYLPHHPVVNDSKPGKVRPVFDYAAKLYDVSLNNQCYQGLNLVKPLVGVLSRFRLYPYVIMGDIEAIVIRGLLLFQEAIWLRLGWDDPVPPPFNSKWASWLSSLNVLDELRFPRCVLTSGFKDGSIEFHHFSDASSVGYGACSFVRTVNADGEIHVSLLATKGRH